MNFETWLKQEGKELEFDERQAAAKRWYACRDECTRIVSKSILSRKPLLFKKYCNSVLDYLRDRIKYEV